MTGRRLPLLLATALLAGAGAVPAGAAFDPAAEVRNAAKGAERGAIYHDPAYHGALSAQGSRNLDEALRIAAADPERQFLTDVCWSKDGACAGDVRLYDWQSKGYGEVRDILFTARNGATLPGRVWATKAGPAKRPAIVIVNGSVQASEELYWWAAQSLAKAGYVVLTFDPQGQGRADTFGEAPDQQDGVPSQTEGSAFFDGAQDALDFLLSTPQQPYDPRPSDTSGTDHSAKQDRRVAEGRNSAFNPLWERVDPTRIGLAGHSYGAMGVSWLGQQDPRVDAIVAWDTLCDPTLPVRSLLEMDPLAVGNGGLPGNCMRGGDLPAPAPTKPALGISGDYVFAPVPHTGAPDPLKRSEASRRLSARGVDTGQLVIRGGTHLEFSFLPLDAFPATLRGIDLSAWYTVAWFDRYVKGDRSADLRLLSDRWRADVPGAVVDADRDGNLFSALYRSRLDVRAADGTRVTCEDLRSGCSALGDDGVPRPYTFLSRVLSGDGTPDPAPERCTTAGAVTVTFGRRRGARVLRVRARAGRRALPARRIGARRVRVLVGSRARGAVVISVRARVREGGRTRDVRVVRRVRTCRA